MVLFSKKNATQKNVLNLWEINFLAFWLITMSRTGTYWSSYEAQLPTHIHLIEHNVFYLIIILTLEGIHYD